MPQRDHFHDSAKRSLIRDGWVITHDPLVLPFGGRNVYVDLGAEAPMAAEKEGRKIAVEVKGFLGPSEVSDLERALGQYALYRFLLRRQEPERELYMAVSVDAHSGILNEPDARDLAAQEGVKMMVFDPKDEVIFRWID